jgi:coenzyme F420 hydrogenase subunit beta
MNNINDVVKAGLCLGCGICSFDDTIVFKNSNKYGHLIPSKESVLLTETKEAFELCPGKGYKIETIAKDLDFGKKNHIDLGYFDQLSAITTNTENVLEKASSSGIMTIIVNHLLENKIVDKVIVSKFEYLENGPNAIAFSASSYLDLVSAQGSKYCPVDFSKVVRELKNNTNNLQYAFIGTPCQIASLRYIQANIKDLGIKYFIGNFCGGFKSNNNLRRLITSNNMRPKDVNFFRFRGGGQPGSLKISTKSKSVEIPYPLYGATTGYSKLKRCHFCVDATAELADFSCGDAWLPRFIDTGIPTSIVITRNLEASKILNDIEKKGIINQQNISEQEVIKSQLGNITTKKYRQFVRMKLYRKLGYTMPVIEEGLNTNSIHSVSFELNVFLSHKIKFIFEKMGLFNLFYYKESVLQRIMYRLFKDNYN